MSAIATIRIKPAYLSKPFKQGTQSAPMLDLRKSEAMLKALLRPRPCGWDPAANDGTGGWSSKVEPFFGGEGRAAKRRRFVAQADRRTRLLAIGGPELPVPRFGVVDKATGKRRAMTRGERKRYRRAVRSGR